MGLPEKTIFTHPARAGVESTRPLFIADNVRTP